MYAALHGGETFSKHDLSHAYQQLVLSQKSRSLLTINTQKRLVQTKRLQSGVHSTSDIFERERERDQKTTRNDMESFCEPFHGPHHIIPVH